MTSAATTDKTCPYCGRTLRAHVIEMFGREIVAGYDHCTCKAALDRRAEDDRHAEAAAERKRQEQRIARLRHAGITPHYLDATTDEDVRSLYIDGPVGVGKTYLASALAARAIDDGRSVRMVSSPEMLSEIRSTYSQASEMTESELVGRYTDVALLVIDDLGKEQPTGWALSVLYRIIDARYSSDRMVIITSQSMIGDLATRLSQTDIDTASAIASRLSEMCERMHMGGHDRRMQR